MTTRIPAFIRHTFAKIVRVKMLLILILFTGQVQAYTVEISETDLQQMVSQGFPVQQQTPFATIILSDPRIRILGDSNRMRLSLAISTAFPNQLTSRGRAEIEGELAYDANKGEFHLRQPALIGLQFDQLPQEYHQMASALVGAIAQQTLPIIVLYRLDEKDIRQEMTKRILKGVTVKDGKLIAELSL